MRAFGFRIVKEENISRSSKSMSAIKIHPITGVYLVVSEIAEDISNPFDRSISRILQSSCPMYISLSRVIN